MSIRLRCLKKLLLSIDQLVEFQLNTEFLIFIRIENHQTFESSKSSIKNFLVNILFNFYMLENQKHVIIFLRLQTKYRSIIL